MWLLRAYDVEYRIDIGTGSRDDDFMNNRNVVLRANYGSGKTTVVMKIVNDVKSSGGRAICLVYNSSMKHEMRKPHPTAGMQPYHT
jgi:superfamily II DNA or RNA helicase